MDEFTEEIRPKKEGLMDFDKIRKQERLGKTKEGKTYKYMAKEKYMEKDAYRLLKLYKAFDVLIATFESVGELDDWDKDQEVDKVYKSVEGLQIDIYTLLRDMGIDPIGEEYED